MADLLTPLSTKKVKIVEPLVHNIETSMSEGAINVETPKSALEVLKSQPSRISLNNVLRYLTADEFSLLRPEPLNASIAHQLVNDTIPNYWRTLKDTTDSRLIARILRNPTGLGHIITRLLTLISDSRLKKELGKTRNTLEHLEDLIALIDLILRGDETTRSILREVLNYSKNEVQRNLIWREYLAQIVSGRVLAIVAEAEDVLKSGELVRTSSWIAEGEKYAAWLGRNMVILLKEDNVTENFASAVQELCSKILGLGYTDHVVKPVLSSLIGDDGMELFARVVSKLKSFEQRKYFNAAIIFMIKEYFSSETPIEVDAPIAPSTRICGGAALVDCLIKTNNILKDHLISTLVRSEIPLLDDSLAVRRCIIAALAKDEEKLHTLLESCIKVFGDSIYVRHTPVLQQEALAQSLAICSGYVHRSQPMFLTMMAKSSYHVNSMSNRIGAASSRARLLGIAIGTTISNMVDKPELQLKFELDGTEHKEAMWYQRLSHINDIIGRIKDIQTQSRDTTSRTNDPPVPKPVLKASKVPASTEMKGPRIMEVLSDSEDGDDDLLAYEKPDSDPEDDTDDPTSINRDKPSAPVYIRDLIVGLRDQENYDRHELALATAASLIRRKANFGREVTDHLEDLASILTGLHNNSELEMFAQRRQQALIAVLLVAPAQMAQWFARSFFAGDYSLTQRIAMLTTLGLGARELAGIKDDSTEELVPVKPSFPSKQLPPHLHKIYAEQNATLVAKLSSSMARDMLSPIASQAADQLTGPNILKVRTFSSRMEVEKKRHKPIPNALAQIVADDFFFPLTGRWWLQVRASPDSLYTSTHLLPTFLQTLSILLNASGPNTVALPQMTREFWDLLLSVRGLASKDKNILNALLFGFLMLLETNENKERLATEQGKELMETQAWVKMVFDGLATGSDEDERVRVLAAGVVVRCQEVVEKYQRRMAGVLMDY